MRIVATLLIVLNAGALNHGLKPTWRYPLLLSWHWHLCDLANGFDYENQRPHFA